MKIFNILLFVLFATMLLSCTKKITKKDINDELIIYPAPPDTARIQFLTKISFSTDVEGKRSSIGKFILGEEAPLPIIKPYGVAINKNKIYICDLDFEGLEIMDLQTKEFNYFKPSGFGQLQLPINCFVDSSSTLYIADVKRKQIVIFNENLEYVTSFGPKENFKPTDVFVANNKIWVANIINGSIDVFKNDSTNEFLYSIPDKENSEVQLFQPTNLYIRNDKLYVSDFGEFNIKIFDLEGNFISAVGSYGKSLGQFARPKGIAVDRDENLFVVDAAFENVQMFNKDGELLMFFGGSYKKSGDMWLPTKITISYDNLELYQDYVDDRFELKYVIAVTNNFGPDKVNIYGYIEEKKIKKK